MRPPSLQLAVTLDAANDDSRLLPRDYVELVREAERGLLDFVTIADDGAEPLDAVMTACHLAARTRHVGLVPVATTTITEPFLVSTQIATLDYVSRGRAGWELRVIGGAAEGLADPELLSAPEERHSEAVDHVEVVRRLWDSWEDGAEIRDAEAHRFLDRDRIHFIDFEGPYFRVRGPSITPRPPQGQPPIVMAARTPRERALAARTADVAIVPPDDGAAGLEHLVVLADLDTTASGLGPRELAERILGCRDDGFAGARLNMAPGDLRSVIRGVVAELQAWRAFRTAYEALTLRGLLGLARPANRYAAA